MDQDAVIFGLAATGYLLLAKDTALRIAGRRWPALGIATAVAVMAHVILVWALRFEWSCGRAWEKSPVAFVVFHSALLLILAAPFVASRAGDRVTWTAFAVVSMGALPAPFRYQELRLLAIPLVAAFLAVVVVMVRACRARRQRNAF